MINSTPTSNHLNPAWLPQDWTFEQYPRQPDIVVIDRAREAGGGMVSLDFKLRVWHTGHQMPRSFPQGVNHTYSGRGWKEAMVRDACAWLEKAMTEPKELPVDKRYPLDPQSIGEDTYIIISRGHHDIHAFMAKVRDSWDWPLGVPAHIWMKTRPSRDPGYRAFYDVVPAGTRGAWPATRVQEAWGEDSYEAKFPATREASLAVAGHAGGQP